MIRPPWQPQSCADGILGSHHHTAACGLTIVASKEEADAIGVLVVAGNNDYTDVVWWFGPTTQPQPIIWPMKLQERDDVVEC